MIFGNKKGMLDDVFDFLFTVMVGFFLLLFLGGVLDNSLKQQERQAIHNLHEFSLGEKNLHKLTLQFRAGEVSYADVDALLPSGIRITTCSRYYNKDDCNNDPLNVAGDDYVCTWDEDQRTCKHASARVD